MNILKWLFNPAWFTFSFGGGGGGQSTTTGTTYTSNIPEYLQPYVERMVGSTEKQVYQGEGFRPYQSYAQYDQARGGTGETVAGFTPLQVQSMQGIQNYQVPGQTQYGSQMAGMAGLGSMRAGQQYARQATNPYATQAYMSPYMEGAVAPQMREAARQSAIQGQANQAQAAQQGAFGGSRSAIVEAERQRNLAQQQADIYGKGAQTAFEQAQQAQQFGANLNLQGLGQGLQGAQALGALGQAQYGQEMGLLGQQQAVGKAQQEFEQNRLNQIVQDYATSQQYPLMQLGVLSNMLRGLPMQSSSTQMYQAQPSMFSQLAGGLGTGLQLYNTANQAFGGGGKKDGGVIKMAKGGIATGVPPGKLPSMLQKLSDPQLTQKDQDQETDPSTKEMVDAEQARRSTLRSGINAMAAGGAIAFNGSERSDVEDKEKDKEKKETTNEGILKALDKAPTTPVIQDTSAEDADMRAKSSMDTQMGIAKEAFPTPAPVAPADPYAAYEKTLSDQAAEQKAKSEEGINTILARKEAERKAAGFENPAIKEVEELKARQAKINEDAKELAQDRLTQFLINWGRTPGSAINGFIGAGDKLITDSIEDKKTRKKLLEDLEDVRRGINRSEYARRLGDEKEAEAIKTKAGEQYYNINKELLKHRADMSIKAMDVENKLKIQEIKNEVAGLKNAKPAIIQEIDIEYARLVMQGAPENAVTMGRAKDIVIAQQPQIQSAAMAVPARDLTAGAAVSQAGTAEDQAETARLRALTERTEKVAKEVRAATMMGPGRKEIKAAEALAKKEGRDPVAAGKVVADRIAKDIEAKIPLPPSVRAPAAAPAPAPSQALTPNADGSFNYTRPRN